MDYWHWWVLAGVLLLAEVLLPAFFFLWLAIAAAVVGLLLLLVPTLGWEYQVLAFSGLSVASIVAFRVYGHRVGTPTDQPALNRRGEQYVGRSFTLERPIVNGLGEQRVDDTTWRIAGPELPAGTRIKVVGVDGVILKVRPDRPDPGQ